MKNNAKVTVLGSFVVDLMGRTPHLPTAGETVKGSVFKLGPGGKGSNQAVAAKRIGANVTMITKIGKDDFADIALDNFKLEGMDCTYIYRDNNRPTGAALIMVDEVTSQNIILVTLGACENINEQEIENARISIEKADVFLSQLETNIDAVEFAVNIAYEAGVRVVLNPAPVQPIADYLYKKINVFIPNEVEASLLSGITLDSSNSILQAAQVFLDKGVENVIITLGGEGALIANHETHLFINAIPVNVVDTTGAGDAFTGAFATALAEGKDVFQAAKFASAAAALSVTKIGTAPAMAYRDEVEEFIRMNNQE